MKLRTKLLLSFSLILILTSIINIYGFFQMGVLANLTTKMYNHPLQVTKAVLNANINIIKMHGHMKDVALANNREEIEEAKSLVTKHEQKVYNQFEIVEELIIGNEGAKLTAKTIQIFRESIPIRNEVISLIENGKKSEATIIIKGKGAKYVTLLNSRMETLIDYAANNANGMLETSIITYTNILTISIIMLIIMLILSGLFGFIISSGIIKSVQLIRNIANKIVAGEITDIVTNRTELDKIITLGGEMSDIGKAFDLIANSFKTVIDDISQISHGLATGDLNVTPKAKYQGDFKQIKQSLETGLVNLRLVIADVVQVSQGLASGDLSITTKAKYQGYFKQIKQSLETGLINLRLVVIDIVQISQGLATGNLRIASNTEYQGDFIQVKDSMETALLSLNSVVKDIVQVSQGLAEGGENVITQAEYQGDFGQIKIALETAASKLSESTSQNITQNWLKTGQTKLSDTVSGEQDMMQLAKNIITLLANYLQMSVGLFYLCKQDKLKLIGSYAYTNRKGIKHEFTTGEGLIGQTALEQKQLHITKVPADYYVHINSGLGTSLPNSLLIQPVIYEDKLKAVIEFASFKTVTETDKLLLTQIMPIIGVAINTAESRSQMQELLQKSQKQSEELQSQQEELQKANEELQGQSEELQSQQEELRQSNETLEERTKDLESQQIEIQEKNKALEVNRTEMEKNQVEMEKTQATITIKAEELELASKYKSEFLANMSHELRTPLNSLLILSKLLEDNKSGNLDRKQIEYAKTINSAGNDLLILINDILDLSKVEAGKIEIQWEDVSLNNLLTSIKQKFAPIANDKGVEFNLTIAENIPPVLLTDGQRIKQIINNLLSNAFKFTSKGEVKLMVQHPNEIPLNMDKLELGKTIAIRVSDNGIGIPIDKQQSVFEAFQQADGSTSRSYGGTGLGLSISRQLARLLGGELTLVSEPDKGSTFTLYLPDKYDKSDLQEKSAIQTSPPIEPPLLVEEYQSPKEALQSDDRDTLSSTDRTILVVEDDRKFSNILKDLSQNKGFKCLIAEDGITGLELAKEHKPNAIILDINLPRMDGLTVMDKLKNNPATRHIPVHFMSASDHSIFAKRMGAIGYLIKPTSIEKLTEAFKKIETVLAKDVKSLLIITNSKLNQQKIMDLVADKDLQIEISTTGDDACQKLLATTYDCVILDMDLEQDINNLLEKMRQKQSLSCKIPIIAYADRDLTPEEEFLLQSFSEEIPIKSAILPENLVDEVTLFLHRIETNLSENKRKMLHMVHDKKAILKHKKVLIVDDDERNIFALATILENNDAEVICSFNGKEALEELKLNDDIAIVLMDIMMPEMDGYEAMQEIRKQYKYKNLPIIALTAKAMKDDKAKCIEAGANDYLAKPVDADKLLSLMRVWLYR